ncbi:bifunctional 3-(3-hydroxy-phenyl)propionate/3-hydroxycinnamic acid hydroxylase [Micromonospora sp. RTGN7]|uniref:bifunctional 3-(3-hydroxy-phenyl)propionate/3-hydroxycinnamic acid hydroxylase MhpA n=1 Tax=Micromonospora sp. RTGN7 TaxID=3016526 RepID=UPI0029FF0CD4|nr:bifunctional 3-(3-hydroxy-phenyl)propionate/3-hydroxycinnamic acid hydroxylase [Micromonospora sp. RTGN7]
MTDVLIVGYGPVGQVAAILLAQRGFTVRVVEKWATPYNMPRAVSYDGEASRILAACGVGDRLDPVIEPSGEYTWKNGFGRTLLHIKVPDGGWPDSISFYQPGLEDRLAERGAELPGVQVLRGVEVTDLADHGDRVEVTALAADGTAQVFTASWVLGCDGANSFVRRWLGTGVTDLGFTHDWLVCDVVLNEPVVFKPNNLQICDPARPRTAVSAGPDHRRWEFMRVPEESLEEFRSEASVWRLLGLFDITPDTARLDRYGVYTTQACYADTWRSGRVFLAGDAAHVMPPFLGQGMSSGFRDVINLAWKLDLVRRGLADDALLDTYEVERRAHVQHAIRMSIDSGKVICETDPKKAAGRDSVMLAALRRRTQQKHARSLREAIVDGVLCRGPDGAPAPHAGAPAHQGRVAADGRTGWFDEVVGTGFVLLTRDVPAALVPADVAFLDGLGARWVAVRAADAAPADAAPADGNGPVTVTDLDGGYLAYLSGVRADALLVRPDFYVFGVAAGPDGAATLVNELRQQVVAPALQP